MDPVFHLTVNIQTPKGMLEIGSFFLGTEIKFAENTFSQLEGSTNIISYPSIRLDLICTSRRDLPVCLKSMGCNLEQYANNCRMLTKEIFKHFMFESDAPLA